MPVNTRAARNFIYSYLSLYLSHRISTCVYMNVCLLTTHSLTHSLVRCYRRELFDEEKPRRGRVRKRKTKQEILFNYVRCNRWNNNWKLFFKNSCRAYYENQLNGCVHVARGSPMVSPRINGGFLSLASRTLCEQTTGGDMSGTPPRTPPAFLATFPLHVRATQRVCCVLTPPPNTTLPEQPPYFSLSPHYYRAISINNWYSEWRYSLACRSYRQFYIYYHLMALIEAIYLY